MAPVKVVTSDQMRAVEARAASAGVSAETLMENAGLVVAERVRHHLGPLVGVPIVVLVGPGNNGGDGLVAARHLHRWGASVLVYLCRDRREGDPQLLRTSELGMAIERRSSDEGCERLRDALERCHLVIDSVLGIGRNRPIEGEVGDVFRALAESRSRRRRPSLLALDVPSGLDADTGAVDAATVPADVTVTLGCPKAGLFAFPGADAVGLLETADIRIPEEATEGVSVRLMDAEWAGNALPDRPAAAHKGSFGRTLVVAGSESYVGAAALAATAATRVGSGLVTLAIPASIRDAIAARLVEPTYMLLPERRPGAVSEGALARVLEGLPRYDAMLVGCGMGQEPETKEFILELLYSNGLPPTVIDADGLNALATSSGGGRWWERLSAPAVLTPHAGEMSRLTAGTIESIQRDRTATARRTAEEWGKVVALKGAYTAVAAPGEGVMLSPFANPGLATAGTGDVLAGAIAGLLSHGMGPADAASLGVYLHGMAGQRVRERLGDMGMIAGDLLEVLPLAIKELREGRGVHGTG